MVTVRVIKNYRERESQAFDAGIGNHDSIWFLPTHDLTIIIPFILLLVKSTITISDDCSGGHLVAIEISSKVREEADAQWKDALIIRVCGLSIDRKNLLMKLHAMWKIKGEVHLLEVGRGVFLATFA